MFKLSKRSVNRLHGVHPDLVRVIERAIQITETDFTVLEGLRSVDRHAARRGIDGRVKRRIEITRFKRLFRLQIYQSMSSTKTNKIEPQLNPLESILKWWIDAA